MLDSGNFRRQAVAPLDPQYPEPLGRKLLGFQCPHAFRLGHFREWRSHSDVQDGPRQPDQVRRQLGGIDRKPGHVRSEAFADRRTDYPGLRHAAGQVHDQAVAGAHAQFCVYRDDRARCLTDAPPDTPSRQMLVRHPDNAARANPASVQAH
ncbi:hypothetical protein D3C71_1660020 [compost metagenome]